MCSTDQMYTARRDMMSLKLDSETRVGYTALTKTLMQVQRIQKPQQQTVPQHQQIQEDIVEIPLPGPGRWKFDKSFLGIQEEKDLVPASKKPSFNVYISCLQEEGKLSSENPNEVRTEAEGEIFDHYANEGVTVFEGVYGNVIIKERLVLYTDLRGKQYCEEYDRETVEKIFPMGIAFGGLSKSIWFKDGFGRDDAFELMMSIPPSYEAVMSNPAKFAIDQHDLQVNANDDNMMIFEGFNNRNVIVHDENLVLYTDLDNNKHCVSYIKDDIKKCFPYGICYGGLPKAVWFNDEMERDECFTLLKQNLTGKSEEITDLGC